MFILLSKVYSVIAHLPQLSIKITLRGIWAESQDGKKEDRLLSTERTQGVQKDWVSVHADQEYVLKIEMNQKTFGHKVTVCLEDCFTAKYFQLVTLYLTSIFSTRASCHFHFRVKIN